MISENDRVTDRPVAVFSLAVVAVLVIGAVVIVLVRWTVVVGVGRDDTDGGN